MAKIWCHKTSLLRFLWPKTTRMCPIIVPATYRSPLNMATNTKVRDLASIALLTHTVYLRQIAMKQTARISLVTTTNRSPLHQAHCLLSQVQKLLWCFKKCVVRVRAIRLASLTITELPMTCFHLNKVATKWCKTGLLVRDQASSLLNLQRASLLMRNKLESAKTNTWSSSQAAMSQKLNMWCRALVLSRTRHKIWLVSMRQAWPLA